MKRLWFYVQAELRDFREPTHIPPDGKTQSVITVSSAELRNGPGQGEPCGHLTKALHHGPDTDASEAIAKEDRERASAREGRPYAKKETCTYCTAEGYELDVSRLEAEYIRVSYEWGWVVGGDAFQETAKAYPRETYPYFSAVS